MQFLFAADRENRQVAGRFDSLSAPSLRALKLIVERRRRGGMPGRRCAARSAASRSKPWR